MRSTAGFPTKKQGPGSTIEYSTGQHSRLYSEDIEMAGRGNGVLEKGWIYQVDFPFLYARSCWHWDGGRVCYYE
jgi:hypothetical protein